MARLSVKKENQEKKNRIYEKHKKARRKHKPRLWAKYLEQQKACQNSIKDAHEKYMESLFEDENGNPAKTFFRTIKAKKKDNVGVAPLRLKDGRLESTSKGKAKALAEQYSGVFKKDDGRPLPNMDGAYPEMSRINVTRNGVELLLKKLNPKKAVGPDRVPTCILKDHADIMSCILQVIYQKSLDTGNVPKDWKCANVIPIHKKECRNTPSNYRPVSLTSVSCKVLEHIVFSSVMKHLDKHKILRQFQHGFRQHHSCETQLIGTIEDLAKGLRDKQQIDMLILDFSKAFDVVGHRRLLAKLRHYGVCGDTHNWIRHWLTGRMQRVVVDGEASEEAPVESGVPQGTVLGPLCFILYINDIANNTDSDVRLFADDALLYRVVNDEEDASRLQIDLDQMCGWAEDWQMDFNPSKCHVLSVTNKRSPALCYPYKINGEALKHVTHHPYLGVQLDSSLSWDRQVNNTVAKAQRTLNLIRRNLHGCSQKTKDAAYRSMVRPILEYASCSWDPYRKGQVDRLEAVQKKAARFVSGQYGRDVSATGLVGSLQWRTLQERRFLARQTMFYKAVNGLAAVTLPPYVNRMNSTITASSHNLQFRTLDTRIDSYKFSFFPRTIRIWNLLPQQVVSTIKDDGKPSSTAFKYLLQDQFLNENMYMVDPRGSYDRPCLRRTKGANKIGPVY